ncbi:NAD-dependent epimerase/dehydratase family protein [Thiobacillus sp.]|uniref:NAD-dependent epimerase/dehydratase family protein n=1 Tax=Thiobacillus sp. TaxID=924 RepID=UPI0025D2EF03|nr:NAD-dependent epimerase/dehydratase family protein [Thiobacillus sp.]
MAAKILVTGASGFIGRALLEHLRSEAYDVLGSVRVVAARERGFILAPELSATSDWREVLVGRDVVVHTAARAHVLKETEQNPLAVFRMVNTAGTLNLARQAAAVGVRRFVFISSIGVHGLFTREGECFTEQSPPAPHNDYALSKWEAEQGLQEISCETGLEIVIVRPPLIYGPGVKANFLHLLKLVESGWPLSLGGIRNRRSFLFLGNFVDAIRLCAEHPDAAGQTFLLDDGEPVSTPELIRAVARAMGRPARLLPVPASMLELAGSLLGKRAAVTRLTSSLVVDSSAIRSRLGWAPPFSMEAGLAATVSASA